MYESPIELVYKETFPKLVRQQEELILRGCLDIGVYVDKEELIKALQYDRGQYEKGFADGRPKNGEWIDTTHGLMCSACKTYQVYGSRFYNFCPICGAEMRGGDQNDEGIPAAEQA